MEYSIGHYLLLALCIGIALGFEFVNGFHDTANAVATVIYTKSLKPNIAIVWSGLLNLLGVVLSGGAVAFSIVHLLPVDLLLRIGESAGMIMVFSLLIAAILWNLGTWYYGLPCSSSHSLIGSILGVGLAASFLAGKGFGAGVNWGKAEEVLLSLLLSPLLGFVLSALLLYLMKAFIHNPKLYQAPEGETPPPLYIRAILFLTCSAVSFSHGSNDGQKGIGLIMLILIGLLPAHFALNPDYNPAQVQTTVALTQKAEEILRTSGGATVAGVSAAANSIARNPQAQASTTPADRAAARLQDLRARLTAKPDFKGMPVAESQLVRDDVLRADQALGAFLKSPEAIRLSESDHKTLEEMQKAVIHITDFVVNWVPLAVALALGLGTMIGWKRIVVTIGEKIGKTHLTYAQGAAAEVVAAGTIGLATSFGMPVSTTHVLASGVAGTMAAGGSGVQKDTMRAIALAWILTLPVTMLLAALLFTVMSLGIRRDRMPTVIADVPPAEQRVITTLH